MIDRYADEPTAELDPKVWEKYQYARAAIESWTREAKKYRALLEDQIGSAHAGVVDGRKVVTYRPKDQWAAEQMRKDNPALAQHYVHLVEKEVFDVDLFARAFPEIAENYHVRSFNVVEDPS